MLKNILKLDGAQELTKNEKKSIKGGNIKAIECDDSCERVASGICDCSRGTWSGQ